MHDSGYRDEALNLTVLAHNSIPDLTLTDEWNYYTWRNIVYAGRKDYERNIGLSDSMLLLLDNAGNSGQVRKWKSITYNTRADALFAKGLYKDAYNAYYQAKSEAADIHDTCTRRAYTYSLAMVLYRQHRFGEAAGTFKEALGESRSCPFDFAVFYFQQEVLDNIGLCYSAVKKYDSAMRYYRMALGYIDSNAHKFPKKHKSVFETAKAVVYGNMAEVHVNRGQPDTAQILYETSIKLNLQKGYTNSDAIIDQVKLAELYHATGDIAAMKLTLDDIKAELDSIPEPRVAMLWQKLMWRYYERKNEPAAAAMHLQAYLDSSEKYQLSHKSLMATDFSARVKDIEQEYRISLLLAGRKAQKIYLVIASAAVLMAVAIILLIYSGLRRSRVHVARLRLLNDTINLQKEQLEQALAELRARNLEKSRILTSVAHDVMSPITAIMALTDLVLRDPAPLTEDHRELVELIKTASDNSLILSRDILEASAEMDPDTVVREWVAVDDLLEECADLMSLMAEPKGQQITLAGAKGLRAYINRNKIARAVNNFLTNAIKFSHNGGKIIMTAGVHNDMLRLSVADYGVGIPIDFQPHIFEMFTEATAQGTAGERPHGLGLSISLQIARSHGGNITFESEKGKGTTFHLDLPLTP
ncbi:MAG: HAMP domain-containing sensor histidine kinase [Bacteroidota bacterium]